jgi:hypothetical protein
MDERDYKAINRELNQPLQQCHVSGQSEMLLAFAKFIDESTLTGLLAEPQWYVDAFLKANNSR